MISSYNSDNERVYEHDGRTCTYLLVAQTPSSLLYVYTIDDGTSPLDNGFVLIGTKTRMEGDSSVVMFYVRVAESEEVYLEDDTELFDTESDALDYLVSTLVGATGTSEYLSQFMLRTN